MQEKGNFACAASAHYLNNTCNAMKTRHTILSLCISGIFSAIAIAQPGSTTTQESSVFQMITTAEGSALTLETDMISLLEGRNSSKRTAGILTLPNGSTHEVNLNVQGRFRRKMSKLPPLKLRFPKKDLRAAGLDTMNEVKFVLPFTLDKQGDELVIREYLVYRMWERLSPYHMRARLIRLNLKDTHTGDITQMYSIALEDKEETKARLNGAYVESYGLTPEAFEQKNLSLMTLFQYMIGNTDWDIPLYRNIRFMQTTPLDKLIPIPYDFDFAGLVKAPYAMVKSSTTGEMMLRQRVFMVHGLAPEHLTWAVDQLLVAKQDLYALCQTPLLNKRACNDMEKYLNTFFEGLSARSIAGKYSLEAVGGSEARFVRK